jgi:DNA polymerase-1
MRERHLLIDGDILVYRFANREQQVVQWTDDLFTFHGLFKPASIKMSLFIDGLMEETNASLCTVVLSDSDANYRKDLWPEVYKINRAGVIRPILYKPLREFLLDEYAAIEEPKLEGDDLLGLLSTNMPNADTIIASIDKDLLTVPGRHYQWESAGPDKFVNVSPERAAHMFITQVLTGDSVDGYKGVPGCGPVKAAKLLGGVPEGSVDIEGWLEDMWHDVVVPAYVKAGLGENVALLNARMARVLRGDEYNFKTQEVQLWTPGAR